MDVDLTDARRDVEHPTRPGAPPDASSEDLHPPARDAPGPGAAVMTASAVADATNPRPGRPRDRRLDDSIVAATIGLLAERGYNGLSLAAVADRAGTTTPAIYRRWPSKADLVLSAVFRTQGDDVVADTGDLDADIRAMVRWSLEKFGSPAGRAAMVGLLGEPAGSRSVRSRELAAVWGRTGDRLARAVQRGEIRSDIDTDGLILQLAGPALLATAVHGDAAATDVWVERIATVILDGIRASGRPSTRPRARRPR